MVIVHNRSYLIPAYQHLAGIVGVHVEDNGKIRPTDACCGAVPLTLATNVIGLMHIIVNTIIIYIASSRSDHNYAGVPVSATLARQFAVWAVIGVPIIIGGGVGMLYRVSSHVRVYAYYMLGTLIYFMIFETMLLTSSGACDALADRSLQRLGKGFVCGSAIAASLFFWLVEAWIWLYLVYIVWSASCEIHRSNYPELDFFITMLQQQKQEGPVGPLTAIPDDVMRQGLARANAPGYGAL